MLRFLLTMAVALCLSSSAWAAALGTSAAVGSVTALGDTTFTQTFTWSFNADQGTDEMVAFDFGKCKSMTRAFDADVISAGTAAEYELYACDSAATSKSSCRHIGGPYSEHSAVAMGAGMFTKRYGMVYPSTVPASGDVATVTFSCTVDDYVYDMATGAWIARDVVSNVAPTLGVAEASLYMNDFLAAETDFDSTNDWAIVNVGTVTQQPAIAHGSANGILQIKADAADNEGHSVLLAEDTTSGFAFVPLADRTTTVEFYFKVSDADDQDWAVGLFEDSASALIDATGDLPTLEYVAWHFNVDDDATATFPTMVYAGADNSETAVTTVRTVTALTDATFVKLGIRLDDTDEVAFFMDDVLVGKATVASAYTAPLYIGLAMVNHSGTADTMDVDYIWASQTR